MSQLRIDHVFGACILWATLAATAAVGTAQEPFRRLERSYPQTARPLTAFDADGDGDQDVLTAEGLLLNDGIGTFSPASGPPFPMPLDRTSRATAADCDLDGDLDLVVISPGPITGVVASVLWNSGGVFASTSPLSGFPPGPVPGLPPRYRPIVVTDFDSDGLPDVFTGMAGFELFRQTSPGVFSHHTAATFTGLPGYSVAFGATTQLVAGADLDADGDVDLVVTSQGAYYAFLDVGVGYTSTSLPLNAVLVHKSAAVGDLNGDGRQDVILSNQSFGPTTTDSVISVLAGGGVVVVNHVRSRAALLAVADVDLDGDQDLLRVDYESATVLDYATGATLAAPPIFDDLFSSFPGVSYSVPLIVFDADQDGDFDILGLGAPDRMGLWLRTPSGFIANGGDLLQAHVDAGTPSLADLDQDGDLDLVRPSYGGVSSIAWRRNDGRGEFGPVVGELVREDRGAGVSVAADFDADGDVDVFSFPPNSPAIWIHLQGPGGLFAPLILVGTPTKPVFAAAAVDQDGDGDLDVVGAVEGVFLGPGSYTPSGVFVWRNQGGGSFTGPTSLYASPFPVRAAAAADFNGDGALDFVLGSPVFTSIPYPIVYAVVDGKTGVVLGTPPTTLQPYLNVAAGDVDGDGVPDLALGESLFRFTATGITPLAAPTAAVTPPGRRLIVDFDGDGDGDLVEYGDGFGYAFENVGGGFGPAVSTQFSDFTPAPSDENSKRPRPLVDDVDRDGDLDLVQPDGRLSTNVRAQLSIDRPAALGRIAGLDVFGSSSEPYELFLSLTLVPQAPQTIPNWGPLWLDPTGATLAAVGSLDAAGRADVDLTLPASPAFDGLTLWWQAVLPAGSRLTNAVRTTLFLP